MQVINEITGRRISTNNAKIAVVDHLPGCIVSGYIGREVKTDVILIYDRGRGLSQVKACLELLGDKLFYSNRKGMWVSKIDLPEDIYLEECYTMGQGKFPYTFERRYEAIENFKRFENGQVVLNPSKTYRISEFLRYSFGLEFETSQGYVPENICFRDGLIPLRDGSISGIEYSTVVLEGNRGIALLEQQLETLRKYTFFNKECSLHIHLGGYPLDPDKLYNLYIVCKRLESEISSLTPDYTFHTSSYKANGKDYCKFLGTYRDFDEMYRHLVGRKFYNDLTQSHPNDIRREAKWRIDTRYYWVNFINALCYDVNKTIEFRFLRPTYNFNKIVLWLYILNAIMFYAENDMMGDSRSPKLASILRRVYPDELAGRLILGLTRLKIVKNNQSLNNDYIGRDITFENELFSGDLGF